MTIYEPTAMLMQRYCCNLLTTTYTFGKAVCSSYILRSAVLNQTPPHPMLRLSHTKW
jgi:hypothetical protein